MSGWRRVGQLLGDRRAVRLAFAEDDDPEYPDDDHDQRRADEQVGRGREDRPGLAQAAQVGDRDEPDGDDADEDPFVVQDRERRDDLLDAPTTSRPRRSSRSR